jgi:hypothetical protein
MMSLSINNVDRFSQSNRDGQTPKEQATRKKRIKASRKRSPEHDEAPNQPDEPDEDTGPVGRELDVRG